MNHNKDHKHPYASISLGVLSVAQLCLTLCNCLDFGLPDSFVHGDSPGKNIGMGCHALLQGIFPNQGLNPGLLHCRQILYHLRNQGSPSIRLNCQNLIIFTYKSHILLFLPNIYISFHLFI